MQKVIDWYFLIVSSVITVMSFCFCIQENNWGNILLLCFSTIVSILYIINILKTSAFFRLFVVCVSAVNGTDSEAFKTTRDSDFVSRDFWYISGKKV